MRISGESPQTGGRRLRRAISLLPILVLLGASGGAAWAGGSALPTGGQFAAGAGAIATTANGLAISQTSSHGIISWQSFSIGAGNFVQFSNGAGATLNRVTGSDLSRIGGLLQATGSVYLINPNGVIVLPGGQVITGGSFIASSRDIGDVDFMGGGALRFLGSSTGTVVNQGSIVAANGDVVLVGRSVRNDGSILAPNGTVGLAAGDDVLLRPAVGTGLGNYGIAYRNGSLTVTPVAVTPTVTTKRGVAFETIGYQGLPVLVVLPNAAAPTSLAVNPALLVNPAALNAIAPAAGGDAAGAEAEPETPCDRSPLCPDAE